MEILTDTIAVTGHRPHKLGNEYSMDGLVSKKVYAELLSQVLLLKPCMMISGMALGVDMIFAQVAIDLKIPFTAAVPFLGQESKWPQASKDVYNAILSKAEKIVTVSPGHYASFKMQKRNEWIVNNCGTLLAVWDGSAGGTANCVVYAAKKNKNIIRINPTDFLPTNPIQC